MLSFVVVEYHSRPHLDRLLASLARYEPQAPVLVSCNSSYAEEVVRQLHGDFPKVTFIHNERNLGYAGGVNRALARVKTPYAAILNPDVELTEGIAEKVHSIFQSDPRLAVVGPKVLDDAGRATCSFRRFIPPGYVFARYLFLGKTAYFRRIQDYYFMAEAPRDASAYADWVSGGALCVRMDACRAIGGMDERYFLYFEDMDWCRVFWRAGWRVAFTPEIVVIHRAQHTGTRRGVFGLATRAARQMIWSYLKYLRKWGFARYSPAAAAEKQMRR